MAQENERKYLVQSDGWRKQARGGEHYRQGYLSTDPDRSVRVRASGKKAVLTIKAGGSGNGNGLSRAEFEYPIPVDDANQLLEHVCRQPLIEKTRFRLPQNGNNWEIDQFEKENDGLVIAELEGADGKAPRNLPRWAGEDVSGDSRYSNASLVEHPYSEWRGRGEKPEPKYHWKSGEKLADGLQRIVSEQLQCAIWHLAESGPTLDEAVHEARKSLKKARSAMRLMQGELDAKYDKQRDQENGVLRAAGLKLSPVRDSQALIEIFDELNQKYREKLGNRSLVSVRDGLVGHKKKLCDDFNRKPVRSTVLKALRESAARIKKWKLGDAGGSAVSRGFARTIGRSQKACAEAYADSGPEAFHEWRKRAKDLRYHFGLIAKAWPSVLDGYEDAAKGLESLLGDDHNLVVLRNTILGRPGNFGKEEDLSAFLEVVDDRQKKLRSEARTLAARLYSEKPKVWRKRLNLCWSVWKDEKSG